MKQQYFQQPSVMSSQRHFAGAPRADIERSSFDRSHGHKTTMDEGYLVPIYVDEVLPGDSFHLKETSFCRMATPLRPVMDNIYFDTFYFFVPFRLVWDNWAAFMGERKRPSDNPELLSVPQTKVIMSNVVAGSLANYMGVPQMASPGTVELMLNALPFRAYWLIWNEWFRDQNLCDPVDIPFDDGPDDLTILNNPGKRGKRHDYFTSALPWPQKGDPVVLPISNETGTLPVVPDYSAPELPAFMTQDAQAWGGIEIYGGSSANELHLSGNPISAVKAADWFMSGLVTDIEGASTGVTINDLRTAFQIQKLLERDARGGTRYIEIILSHFGVQSDDARLQRPEYLGGGSTRININPIPSTFRSAEVAQGELGGVATALNHGSFSKSFTEHGIIIGMANVRADITYQNGLDRLWKRFTRYDYYWPAFAHLGEQTIANSEIFLTGSDVPDGLAWGYQERYAEYRYKPSRISGRFASADSTSLDVWHLAEDYTALPPLNKAFIEGVPPIDRIVAVPSEPHFLLDIWFDLKCSRPMPVYSVPGMVDHF